MSLRLKLLSILPRLARLAWSKGLSSVLEELPEARTRSTVLRLYDDSGSQLCIWIGFEDTAPAVREVDCRRPPAATTEISMHVDTFIAILKGRLDFRAAYLYDLVDIKSNDGLPATYHFLLWAAFFDRLVEGLGVGRRGGEAKG